MGDIRKTSLIGRFKQQQDGHVAVIACLAIIPILTIAGIAIDMQMTTTQKNRVQHTIDSAVIAGSRAKQQGKTDAEIILEMRAYAKAQMASFERGMTCEPLQVTFPQSANDERIDASISCSQPTTLTNIIGKKKMDFTVSSETTYGIGKVDVAFIFDVSGSMNWNGRLPALKNSAKIAFDELIPDNFDQEGKVRLSIVTYNNVVNAGNFFDEVTEEVRLAPDANDHQADHRYEDNMGKVLIDTSSNRRFFYYQQQGDCLERRGRNCQKNRNRDYEWTWQRMEFDDTDLEQQECVYARTGPQAFTNAAPGRSLNGVQLSDSWISAGNPQWLRDEAELSSWFSNWVMNYYGVNGLKYYGQYAVEQLNADKYGHGAYIGSYSKCRDSGPVPLTDNKALLEAHVDSLTADGGTAGHLGIAWAWYLLSPEWSGIWPAASNPWPWDEPEMAKAVILMTDGDFNTAHTSTGMSSFNQAMQLCDAMKQEPYNIQIYTVGFQVPRNVQTTNSGETILEYCASSEGQTFSAASADELETVYKAIAESISDLRITR